MTRRNKVKLSGFIRSSGAIKRLVFTSAKT